MALVIAHSSSVIGDFILAQATAVQQQQVPEGKLAEYASSLPTDRALMSGQLLPCKGDACPKSFPVPPFAKRIGTAIERNSVRPPLLLVAVLFFRAARSGYQSAILLALIPSKQSRTATWCSPLVRNGPSESQHTCDNDSNRWVATSCGGAACC
jgi:hypothetical protein